MGSERNKKKKRAAKRVLGKNQVSYLERTGASFRETASATCHDNAVQRGDLKMTERRCERALQQRDESLADLAAVSEDCKAAKAKSAIDDAARQHSKNALRDCQAALITERSLTFKAEERAANAKKELEMLRMEVDKLLKEKRELCALFSSPNDRRLSLNQTLRDEPFEQETTYSQEEEIEFGRSKVERLSREIEFVKQIAHKHEQRLTSAKKANARLRQQVNRKRRKDDAELDEGAGSEGTPSDSGGRSSPEPEFLARTQTRPDATDQATVVERVVKQLRPERRYGENAARMCQELLQRGCSLTGVGRNVETVLRYAVDVNMRSDLGLSLHRDTVKLLALGITMLDAQELKKAILAAPFLLIAGDESLRHGDKKFPIFVAFWDEKSGRPWWGMFRVCSMRDKTAQTQANLFSETVVKVLGYPRERVLYVLSDNTASVSAEVGGCVALLQREWKGEENSTSGGGASTASARPKNRAGHGDAATGARKRGSRGGAAVGKAKDGTGSGVKPKKGASGGGVKKKRKGKEPAADRAGPAASGGRSSE